MRIFFLICFFASQPGFSQYKLRIEIKVIGGAIKDTVFVASNLNEWHPGDLDFRMVPENDRLVFEKAEVPKGVYEYKYTRGSWDKVETGETGADIKNRLLRLTADTIIYDTISSWKDNFVAVPKAHTASENVHILDTAFHMSLLNRDRRIWIYLPPGYKNSPKRYPVFYMHDGQNLFDEATSGFREWGIDEILDSLAGAGKASAIVVGIENSPRRMNEYNPYYFEKAGEGEGSQYVDFIIRDLKPFIDKHYKTLASKENTIIAGSSMGGLISFYAALKYPSIFGRAGVFSPSFWSAPEIKKLTDTLAPASRGMFFFYSGEMEGEEMVGNMNDIISQLGRSSNALLYTVIDPDGNHNEAAWRKWFAEFYLWVTSNGLNHIIR